MILVQHRPWSEIVGLYRSLTEKHPELKPLLNLVEQIAGSDYARGLFASTSMASLMIAQTPEFDMEREVLFVRVDAETGGLIFDFQETASALPKYQHWIRRCSSEQGFSQLSEFVKLKKWFALS